MKLNEYLDMSQDCKVAKDASYARKFRNTQYLTVFKAKTSAIDIYE